VSRIFLSHSATNNAEAVALHSWLEREGWKDEIFLDLDPVRGIAAGGRWERTLVEAANRCEAVLFLISRAWIASEWCLRELNLAHRLNKRLFGVLIEDLPIAEVPKELTGDWQLVRLASGRDHILLQALVPITHEEVHVTFSSEGLQRLKHGLEQAGLDPKFFSWPPANDPSRPPYRGLRPLEVEDAGIFFGRDAPVIEALDRLRGLREVAPPRLLVILGASGAGKSSFLRAGLLPRLKRDDRSFLPIPIIRPERAALFGDTGLLRALERALQAANIAAARADLRAAVEHGADKLRALLKALVDKAIPPALDANPTQPTLIISIDQGEELFLSEGQGEAHALLAMLRDLTTDDAPALIVLLTIRSDAYEQIQLAKELEGVHQETLSLPRMPKGSYADVIRGPARQLEDTSRAFKIDDALVDALLADIEEGGATDALPLLAFTLERLYLEYGARRRLTLADYRALGGIKGSIEAAVEAAFTKADQLSAIPRDPAARLALLRRGLIPWLAGIDSETGSPRRRVARRSEIPEEARPLIELLVDERLLATDVSQKTDEHTIEPVHEAVLRQWGLLQGWLTEDAGFLRVLDGVKRASRDWAANDRDPSWLAHMSSRLEGAERVLRERADLTADFTQTDRDYLAACRDRKFLVWKQDLEIALTAWRIAPDRRSKRNAVLAGSALAEAHDWVRKRGPELSQADREFIQRGIKRQHTRRVAATAGVLGLVALAGVSVWSWLNFDYLKLWAAKAQNCEKLWVERNSYYHAAGYCFQTRSAIRHFGNEGCIYRNMAEAAGRLSPGDSVRINDIVKLEAQLGCPKKQ
jgi:hypothetical protein